MYLVKYVWRPPGARLRAKVDKNLILSLRILWEDWKLKMTKFQKWHQNFKNDIKISKMTSKLTEISLKSHKNIFELVPSPMKEATGFMVSSRCKLRWGKTPPLEVHAPRIYKGAIPLETHESGRHWHHERYRSIHHSKLRITRSRVNRSKNSSYTK